MMICCFGVGKIDNMANRVILRLAMRIAEYFLVVVIRDEL